MDELPNPITRSEQYLAKIAGAEPTLPTPITREERYLAKIAGEDVDIPPAPITRTEQYLAAIVEGGGGVEVESLSVTENGTYTAEEGKAYSPVSVAVPNSYAAGDEGKVVSNGALVAQTSDSVTENGTVDTTLISSLEVNVPQGGGGGDKAPEKDVNFIDYDGTILYSYTAEEFAALDALPANPEHEGLTAQGWNWTLADAKQFVNDAGKLWIGQLYVTDDDATKLYIKLDDPLALSPQIGLTTISGSITVDWGDGTVNNSSSHTYATIGEYCISITTTGSYALTGTYSSNSGYSINDCILGGVTPYGNTLKKANIGANCRIGRYAFYGCACLEAITIPKTATLYSNAYRVFALTTSLKALVIPPSITTFYNAPFNYSGIRKISLPKEFATSPTYMFNNCDQLVSITGAFTTAPEGVFQTGINYNQIYTAMRLREVCIPNVTSIGNSAFLGCGMTTIIVPPNVTSIAARAFEANPQLCELRLRPAAPPTVANSNAWTGLKSTVCKIYIPYASLAAYLTASNYPAPASYTYIGFATYNSGVTLPTQDSTEAYNVVWYASKDDAIAQTNPITQGNGKEVYCRYTAV